MPLQKSSLNAVVPETQAGAPPFGGVGGLVDQINEYWNTPFFIINFVHRHIYIFQKSLDF